MGGRQTAGFDAPPPDFYIVDWGGLATCPPKLLKNICKLFSPDIIDAIMLELPWLLGFGMFRMIAQAVSAFALTLSLSLVLPAHAEENPPQQVAAPEVLPSIVNKTKGMTKQDGYIPLYVDEASGSVYMEIPRISEDMIYQISLPRGLGSKDVGLDRGGLLAETRIVRFDRWGRKVLLVQPNLKYRAVTENPHERRSVDESFAESVLWGFEVSAESEGHVLIDVTEFVFKSDLHNIPATIKMAEQGEYALSEDRNALYLPNVKAFPRNTEIEVALTFTSAEPGEQIIEVAPTPEAITVHARHSFVALPEPGYVMRSGDPRAGYFNIELTDYAAPLEQPLQKRFIKRHRLEKEDPFAAVSPPVKPIVYYVDRGIPSAIRTAILEGARWWNEAFEAAGYLDAFRVELLPEGADPMDVQYNIIQWVHRSTRGWSRGDSVYDPRTGEIIQGRVSLGSLRDRQDNLIAEGLLAPYERGDEHVPELQAFVLARLRQLAAHEVGHTLGLVHNFAASSEGRTSVMDYPYPWIQLNSSGRPDLAEAYDTKIGGWDKAAIAYGYQDFPEGTDEKVMLDRLLADTSNRGLTLLTDQDAGPDGVNPRVERWDNSADAAEELRRVMDVRRVALNYFGEQVLQTGMPLATMEEALVPIYLFHRYQVEAAVKMLGGQFYTYALRGDDQQPKEPVPAADQQRALNALLSTLNPTELVLPTAVLERLPPRPYTHERHRELFDSRTGLSFDIFSPPVTAAELTVASILKPERAARLVEQQTLSPELPGLDFVIDQLIASAYERSDQEQDAYRREMRYLVQRVVAEQIITLAADAPMPQVRAIAEYKLAQLRDRLRVQNSPSDAADGAYNYLLVADLTRFLDRRWEPQQDRRMRLTVPPGPPIGE
ncbi:MAG TPA: zinc-dependent metalloprotease [Geminicoccus sp.]|uniref:zinc-dependent metalloprotease n=1 Tax=Geminicoccus sp. TaxID=2024832 RepID=UPI002E32C434|nr:zinc-dependent metalloprotease [Geminicoccus sp.]HEX2524819.1 zinc-dependent metalloprotease [Geminicoccus sp.]